MSRQQHSWPATLARGQTEQTTRKEKRPCGLWIRPWSTNRRPLLKRPYCLLHHDRRILRQTVELKILSSRHLTRTHEFRTSIEYLDLANNRFAKLETATMHLRRIPIGSCECAPAHQVG